MKLTVLGCNGPFAAPGGACSSYLLSHGETNILLDCGPGSLGMLERYMSIGELDAIVLSHMHYDHVSDLFSGGYNLQQLSALGRVTRRLPLLLPDEPALMREQLAMPVFEPISLDGLVDAGQKYSVGGLTLSFMRVRHPVPAFAIRAEADGKSFVYTGDTNTCEGLSEFARGADLLLCDAGLTSAQWSESAPHLSGELCGKLASEAGAKLAVGTHINPRADQQALLDEMKKDFANSVLAKPGMVIELQ